tara:strand:+ start:32 stop:514 length:483 start_codon:yes stop_codon:yes gene_type:complete
MDDENSRKQTNYTSVVLLSAVSAALLTLIMMNTYKTDANRDELKTRERPGKDLDFFFVDPEYVVFREQVSQLPSGDEVAYDPFILNRLNFPETYELIMEAVFPVTSFDRTQVLIYSNNLIKTVTIRSKPITIPHKDVQYRKQKDDDIAKSLKLMENVKYE